MAEKSKFSDLVQSPTAEIPADAKCCLNCAHARGPITTPGTLKPVMQCKALPPGLISIPTRDVATGAMSVQVHPRWPELAVTDECDYFHPKNGV